ncbi:hypothetical protein CEXT_431671 [Caerostris extrusa]|uniref:Uncharacterized protein n=1 Tax=Caerostris extrusa TaxID=172846 RepID=A0AAV4VJ75_CAEEX|nr:hypothetical protein CEXT_431671 [Caerostris extrusa]
MTYNKQSMSNRLRLRYLKVPDSALCRTVSLPLSSAFGIKIKNSTSGYPILSPCRTEYAYCPATRTVAPLGRAPELSQASWTLRPAEKCRWILVIRTSSGLTERKKKDYL